MDTFEDCRRAKVLWLNPSNARAITRPGEFLPWANLVDLRCASELILQNTLNTVKRGNILDVLLKSSRVFSAPGIVLNIQRIGYHRVVVAKHCWGYLHPGRDCHRFQ